MGSGTAVARPISHWLSGELLGAFPLPLPHVVQTQTNFDLAVVVWVDDGKPLAFPEWSG